MARAATLPAPAERGHGFGTAPVFLSSISAFTPALEAASDMPFGEGGAP
jgi:hypothetical protein